MAYRNNTTSARAKGAERGKPPAARGSFWALPFEVRFGAKVPVEPGIRGVFWVGFENSNLLYECWTHESSIALDNTGTDHGFISCLGGERQLTGQ